MTQRKRRKSHQKKTIEILKLKNATTGAEISIIEKKNERKINETKSWLFEKINNTDKPLVNQMKKKERSDKFPIQERSKRHRRPCRRPKATRGHSNTTPRLTARWNGPTSRNTLPARPTAEGPERVPGRRHGKGTEAGPGTCPHRGPGPDAFPGEVSPHAKKDRHLFFPNPSRTPKGWQHFPAPQNSNHRRGRTYPESNTGQRQCGKETEATGQESLGTWM